MDSGIVSTTSIGGVPIQKGLTDSTSLVFSCERIWSLNRGINVNLNFGSLNPSRLVHWWAILLRAGLSYSIKWK
jgi:hypothetical protein